MKLYIKNFFLLCLATYSLFFLIACNQNFSSKEKSQLTFQGYVEGELVHLSSAVPGALQNLPINRGNPVKQGDLLFKLDPEPEYANWLTAQATLTEAEAQLKDLRQGERKTVLEAIEAQISQTKTESQLARIRVNRLQTLYKSNAIDKDSLDAAVTLYEVKLEEIKELEANLAEAKLGGRKDLILAQEAVVKKAEAAVEETAWALAQKSVISPTDGIVFDTFFRKGEWVPAGQPVTAILAPQYIRFIFFVPETVLSKMALGETLFVTCDSCKKSYPATISYISPTAEYTPPLIYSRENNYNLVFRVKAKPQLADALLFHPGQPIYVTLSDTITP